MWTTRACGVSTDAGFRLRPLAWQILQTGCVLQTIVTSAGGRTLSIRDVRAVDSLLWQPAWDADAEEPGVCLLHDNYLLLEKRRVSGGAEILCSLSLHSLGRWYQRQLGGAGTLEALTRELGNLAEVAPALIPTRDQDLHIEVASGVWHGHVAFDIDGQRPPWVSIRTFF